MLSSFVTVPNMDSATPTAANSFEPAQSASMISTMVICTMMLETFHVLL